VEDADAEGRKKIREDQKKCGEYPDPNYFLEGYCCRYRPPTGHCDLHYWVKKEKKDA
jgi:hypothetical protein